MKSGMIFTLFVLSLFLIACSKTEVVKLDQSPEQQEETAQETPVANQTETPVVTPNEPVANTDTTGKTAVKCTDSDGADAEVDYLNSGKTTVTYNDGSKKDFIDECPVPNEFFQTEYYCEGNNVKSKMNICKTAPCVVGICIE